MNALYDDALETKNQATLLKAAMIAEKLAPYVHPRLSSITQTNETKVVYVAEMPTQNKTAEEWAAANDSSVVAIDDGEDDD